MSDFETLRDAHQRLAARIADLSEAIARLTERLQVIEAEQARLRATLPPTDAVSKNRL
jgi:prefoldin subunit 5